MYNQIKLPAALAALALIAGCVAPSAYNAVIIDTDGSDGVSVRFAATCAFFKEPNHTEIQYAAMNERAESYCGRFEKTAELLDSPAILQLCSGGNWYSDEPQRDMIVKALYACIGADTVRIEKATEELEQ